MFVSTSDRPLRFVHFADVYAGLIGLGGGLIVLGWLSAFHAILDRSPQTTRWVLAASMAACGFGVYAPHRLARWAADRVWRRWWTSSEHGASGLRVTEGPSDRPLQAIVLGGLALLCGVMAVIGRLGFAALEQSYAALLNGFLIDRPTLWLIEALLVTVVCGLMLTPVGGAWSAVQQFTCPRGTWHARPLVGGLAGLGISILLAGLPRTALPPGATLLLASAPFFTLAILALWIPPSERIPLAAPRRDRRHAAPRAAQTGAALVGTCTVLNFAGSVLSVCVWHRVFCVLSGHSAGGALVLVIWCMGVAGGVALVAVRFHHPWAWLGSRAFPGAVCAAGTALAASVHCVLGYSAWDGSSFSIGLTLLAVASVGAPAVAAGLAVARGLHSLRIEASDATGTGPAFVTWLLLAAGSIVAVVVGPMVRSLGSLRTLVLVSVSGLGIAVVLLLRRRGVPGRPKAAVVAALAGCGLAIGLGLPAAEHGWMLSRASKRLALQESDWVVQSIWAEQGDIRTLSEPSAADTLGAGTRAPVPTGTAGPLIDWGLMPPAGRAIVVGGAPNMIDLDVQPVGWSWDHVRFDSLTRAHPDDGSGESSSSAPAGEEPAARFLRRTHRRYDLVVLDAGDLPAGLRGSREWAGVIRSAVRRLLSDGAMVVLTPMADCSRSALRQGLLDLVSRGELEVAWRFMSIRSEPYLVLGIGRGEDWRRRFPAWARGSSGSVGELFALLGAEDCLEPFAAHSPAGGLASMEPGP